tara:strand:+ start:99 stop:299 length:201 start_codon:yes stop_codon:yes gene_type:complete
MSKVDTLIKAAKLSPRVVVAALYVPVLIKDVWKFALDGKFTAAERVKLQKSFWKIVEGFSQMRKDR